MCNFIITFDILFINCLEEIICVYGKFIIIAGYANTA